MKRFVDLLKVVVFLVGYSTGKRCWVCVTEESLLHWVVKWRSWRCFFPFHASSHRRHCWFLFFGCLLFLCCSFWNWRKSFLSLFPHFFDFRYFLILVTDQVQRIFVIIVLNSHFSKRRWPWQFERTYFLLLSHFLNTFYATLLFWWRTFNFPFSLFFLSWWVVPRKVMRLR